MKLSMYVVLCSLVLVICSHAEDLNATSELGKQIRIASNIGFATNISRDKQAATIIFDNTYVELNSVQTTSGNVVSQTEIQTKVVTVRIPYSTENRSVKMRIDIRGFVDSGSCAAARLVAIVGDATQVIDLSRDEGEIELKGIAKQTLAAKQDGIIFDDFQDRITFTLHKRAAKPVCQITLFLLAERDTDMKDTGGALLVVDSFDIEIEKAENGKFE